MGYLRAGELFYAVRNKEYPYVFVAKWYDSEVEAKRGEWWAKCAEIPSAEIMCFTKSAVINAAEQAVDKHVGPGRRIQVTFELPQRKPAPLALKP